MWTACPSTPLCPHAFLVLLQPAMPVSLATACNEGSADWGSLCDALGQHGSLQCNWSWHAHWPAKGNCALHQHHRPSEAASTSCVGTIAGEQGVQALRSMRTDMSQGLHWQSRHLQ